MTYIVSEIAAASPDMAAAEFKALVEDIRKHGQLVPIWKSRNEIIDGRKRLRACEILGITPKFVNLSPDQSQADLAYSLNILRTHWTRSQRAMFAARRANYPKGKASAVMLRSQHLVTDEEAASEADVDRGTVIEAKRVRRDGAPEVVAAVEAGHLTLHSAREIVATVPLEEQPDAVAKVIKASRGRRRQTSIKVLGMQKDRRRPPTRPLRERMERTLVQLETVVDYLVQFVDEGGSFDAVWTRRLYAARTKLSQAITRAKARGRSA